MTDNCKRLAVEGEKFDRLMDLPINVLHQIQDHMPIEDAARMSILSRPCRFVWASNPKLIFDAQFCKKRTISKAIDIISTILLLHQGSIKQFELDISRIHSSHSSTIDKWMLCLSRNGLLYLTLLNLNSGNAPYYRLPSYVYSMGLERLFLVNCIFRPPSNFKIFDKLTRLVLRNVAFELDVATSSLWMPSLEKLIMMECSGLHLLNIYASELIYLFFVGCGTNILKFSPFINHVKLETVGLVLRGEVLLDKRDRELKLTNLLSSWPNLSHLTLGRYSLKFLASGTGAENLPMYLARLGFLVFSTYNFDDEDLISPLLCILSCSPNLKELHFYLCQRKKSDMEVDVDHFEGLDCRARGLNNLQTLQINMFRGSRTEMHFVKFVLASAPLLQKVDLLVDTSIHDGQSLKISKELMRFPRASPKSEIIYEPCLEEHAKIWLTR